MIESWGPVTINIEDTARKMGMAFRERQGKQEKKTYFPSVEAAAQKFQRSIERESPLSLEAAKILVERNLGFEEGKGFTWTYDPRLKQRELLSPSEEQVC